VCRQIELIDGDKLVELLKNLKLGIKRVTAYEMDAPFFSEFQG
jgi:restriction endonuclease Mrr